MGSDNENDCVFCRIVKGEIPSTKVFEDEAFLVFKDINPAAPTHLLAIPKRHREKLSECGDADSDILAGLLLTVNKAAKASDLDSFRMIINNGKDAGQTVFHLHAHILGGTNMGEKLL